MLTIKSTLAFLIGDLCIFFAYSWNVQIIKLREKFVQITEMCFTVNIQALLIAQNELHATPLSSTALHPSVELEHHIVQTTPILSI